MTKKDYQLIADVLAAHLENARSEAPSDIPLSEADAALATLNDLTHDLSRKLKLDNPRFDRVRFLRACGADA